MNVFRSVPRKASPVPNPFRLCWIPRRVGASNMSSTSSNSTGCGRAK